MFEKESSLSGLTRSGLLLGGLYLYGKPLLAAAATTAAGIGLAHLLTSGKGYENTYLKPGTIQKLETLAAYDKATQELRALKNKLNKMKNKKKKDDEDDDENDIYSDRIIL
jgi:hypothetical protein